MLPTNKDVQHTIMPPRVLKKDKKSSKERRTRLLYIPTGALWVAGLVMTFCSTVYSIGRTTVFWRQRELFIIIGPVTLGLGVIALMVTVALINRQRQIRMKHMVTIVPAPVGAQRPYHKRAFSFSSDRITVQQCPQCHHQWAYPTDIKVDITRGDTEKCRVIISNRASPTETVPPTRSQSHSQTDYLYSAPPIDAHRLSVNKTVNGLGLTDNMRIDGSPDDVTRYDECYSESETARMLHTSRQYSRFSNGAY